MQWHTKCRYTKLAMIECLATHLLLRPEDIRPSDPDWEVIGVVNPCVARELSRREVMNGLH